MTGFHERLERDRIVKTASERSFGITIGVILLLFAGFPLLRQEPFRTIPGIAGLLLIALAFAQPKVLRPLNKLWSKVGWVLERTVTPLIVGAVFCLVFVPFGLVLRLFGVLKMQSPAGPAIKDSYWRLKEDKLFTIENFKRQF